MNKILVCNPFQNVVPTGLAVLDLNNVVGNTLETINLTLGGTTFTKAMITGVALKVNGKIVFQSNSGTNIDMLEQFKGYVADPQRLSINFMEVKARTPNAFAAGSYLMDQASGIVNMRLEVMITGATAPTLTALAEVSPAIIRTGEDALARLMHRRHTAVYAVVAAGVKIALPVPHLDPAGGGSKFKRVAFYSNNMTQLTVQRSGMTELDISVADMAFVQKKAGRVPQTGMVVLDDILDNTLMGNIWDTTPAVCNQAIVYGTFSAAETITIETEELITLDQY